MNVLCGPNGIGKTTILESIAHCFAIQQTSILKKHALSDSGEISAEVSSEGQELKVKIALNAFMPGGGDHISGLRELSSKLLSLKINRTFDYKPLNAVSKDVDKPLHIMSEEAKSGVRIEDIKNWFVNRFLYSAHPGVLTSAQLHNLDVAKKAFSLLQDGFSFNRVLASSNEIMVNSPSGEIYYEYLSSGFKSCLSLILGIIKEIEYRFTAIGMRADEFDGIILIDEIELHLHPEWQAKISELLKGMFPVAQFIASTHSPHVIQAALPNEVIALEFDQGVVVKRQIASHKYGFQGWSIEDILIDVMGMKDVRTERFRLLTRSFEDACASNDRVSAERLFEEIELLLHPSDILRKLMKLQFAGMENSVD
jgi:hypothetical protein